jgi:hypothetical protein
MMMKQAVGLFYYSLAKLGTAWQDMSVTLVFTA